MKRFSQLTQTATEADLVAGNFLAIDVPGVGGVTKKVPGNLVALQGQFRVYEHVGFLKDDGTFSTDENFHCYYTGKILASSGDVVHYMGAGRTQAQSILFCNSSGSIISADQVESLDDFHDFTCPENTAFIIVSSYAGAGVEITFNFYLNDERVKLIYNEFNLVYSKIDGLQLNGLYDFEAVSGYLTSTGTIASASGTSYITDYIEATAGDEFYYKGNAKSLVRSVVYFNANKTAIGSEQINSPTSFTKVTCPANTAFVRFCSYLSGAPVVFGLYKENTQTAQIEKAIESNKINGEISFYSSVGFLRNNGAMNSSESYHSLLTDYIPAEAGDVFTYQGIGRSDATSVIFFAADKTIISYAQHNSPLVPVELTCPANTKFVRFCSFATVADDVILSVKKKGTQIYGLSREFVQRKENTTFYEYKESVGYLRNNGEMGTNESYHCYITDKVPAAAGDVFIYQGVGRSDAASAVFFNATNNVISSVQKNSPYEVSEIVCPANTAYVIFCSFALAADEVILALAKEGTELARIIKICSNNAGGGILAGKKWYACGDSFTHGDFTSITPPTIPSGRYAGQLAVYPYLIGDRTNCDVQNIAVNGGTLSGNGFTKSSTGLLYTTDFSDADYITLYYGINDSHQNVPIGTIDDADNTTFYGAWNIALDYLTTNYPNAHIGLIISNGCDTADYPTATKAIAEKWGVPYLDLDGGVNCPTMLRCSSRNPASATIKSRRYEQQRVSATNGHPNATAHEIESTFIEAWLRSL